MTEDQILFRSQISQTAKSGGGLISMQPIRASDVLEFLNCEYARDAQRMMAMVLVETITFHVAALEQGGTSEHECIFCQKQTDFRIVGGFLLVAPRVALAPGQKYIVAYRFVCDDCAGGDFFNKTEILFQEFFGGAAKIFPEFSLHQEGNA